MVMINLIVQIKSQINTKNIGESKFHLETFFDKYFQGKIDITSDFPRILGI